VKTENIGLSVRKLATMGMSVAIIFVCGYFLKFTTFGGYYNLEDVAVLMLAMLLGGQVVAVGAIGAALCDILSGSAVYAIPSTVIYALAGIAAHQILKKDKTGPRLATWILAALAVEAVVFGGYVSFYAIYLGPEMVMGGVMFLIPQLIANFILSLVAHPIVVRIKKAVKMP
jgi:uncharacterized membrane protein